MGHPQMKTNAVRLLDTSGVRYELREYEVDPDDLAAESVAAKIGMPPDQVFKTLLARGDRNGPCFAVIPGNYELDLSGDRKVDLVSLQEAAADGIHSRRDGAGREEGLSAVG